MTNVVDVVNSITFAAFFVLLAVGTVSTAARVAYYRVHNEERPRLLIRDLLMIGGFSLSFGAILLVRVLRALGLDVTGLSTNVWWAIGSALPAVIAVAVYAWFELFVIERGQDQVRDETYFRPLPPPSSDDQG